MSFIIHYFMIKGSNNNHPIFIYYFILIISMLLFFTLAILGWISIFLDNINTESSLESRDLSQVSPCFFIPYSKYSYCITKLNERNQK